MYQNHIQINKFWSKNPGGHQEPKILAHNMECLCASLHLVGFEQVKFVGLVSNDALTETSSSGAEIARADSLFFTSLGSWVLA